MSMLSKLLSMSKTELQTTLQSVDASAVKGRGLRRRFEKIRNKQGGFTLLELLVVVAILAAIAGTASLALHDTDRRANAGAHVAMMDQIAKAVNTYTKLNEGKFPAVWDSLMVDPAKGADAAWLPIVSSDLTDQLEIVAPAAAASGVLSEAQVLFDAGITSVRGIDVTARGGDCAANKLETLIKTKGNDVVPINIYQLPGSGTGQTDKGGCGAAATALGSYSTDAQTGKKTFTDTEDLRLAMWDGDLTRIGAESGDRVFAFGISPGTTLLNPKEYAGLMNTPIYRHVESHEYAGFVVLFNVSTADETVTFQAVIDGAGDTKDEELGELDNLRNT